MEEPYKYTGVLTSLPHIFLIMAGLNIKTVTAKFKPKITVDNDKFSVKIPRTADLINEIEFPIPVQTATIYTFKDGEKKYLVDGSKNVKTVSFFPPLSTKNTIMIECDAHLRFDLSDNAMKDIVTPILTFTMGGVKESDVKVETKTIIMTQYI